MTTTPEATKGVPRHEGNSTFTPRADHNALADWVLSYVGESVGPESALPVTGNWVGRTITATVAGGGSLYVCMGLPADWRRFSSSRMASGTVTSSTEIAAGDGVTIPVSFPSGRFTLPPVVFLTPTVSSRIQVAALSITAAGFSARLDNFTSGSTVGGRSFNWIAIQFP